MIYNTCEQCKGKHECNQPLVGYVNGARCRFNLRGTYNTNEILKPKYKQFTCDNFNEIKEHINKYHSIYVHGKYGLGKSHMLFWLANKYNLQGHNVFFMLVPDIHEKLINEIKFNKATGEVKTSIKQIMREVELLFLDDLGSEHMTDFVHETLQSVVDYRYRNELPIFRMKTLTIITKT